MNAREKKLAIIVGGLVGCAILALLIRVVVFQPLKQLDQRANATRGAIQKAEEERRKFFTAEDKVKGFAKRTFADTVERASAASGELIMKAINSVGLQEGEFTRLPVGPRRLRGAGSEIGWSVQGQGPLTNIVDLLFHLGSTPHIKQMDGLSLSPGDAPGHVRVRFRYLTMVVEPAPDVVRTQMVATASLQSPERAQFDVIAARDLLRPYLKRPTPPPVKNPKPGQPGPTQAPAGPEIFRVVSLSEWEGAPEVHVLDTVNNKTKRYVIGDELLGGRIVMVDYRPLPHPGRALLSMSRVIIKAGQEYWAVERGGTLAEKRVLEKKDLPPELASSNP
ncbi:MAG TPA: hypothetical protein VEH27_05780 [Methylomirabilota bacterium]|nr:hypothetical protein [Methylomirabilota bacterium]